MALTARRLGKSISTTARQRIHALRAYPPLDTWMNPLTRSLTRHLANQVWFKTHEDLDFSYRLTDVEIAGLTCVEYETQTTRSDADAVIFYVHGGAMVSGSPRANAAMVLPTCFLSGLPALGADYTLVPEARYPTQLEEIDRIYRAMLGDIGDRKIIIFGDSMGGSLVLALLLKWRDEGLRLPDRTVLISPALDGDGASDTHRTMDRHDPLMRSHGGRECRRLFNFYAPGQDLKNPMISPIYGDLTGLPPMLIHVGGREVLLGDAARVAEAARLQGVESTLRVFDGMFHLFHMHWSLPEAKAAHADIADFISAQ